MSQYLHLKCAEFIVTYHCNSHCKHCHVGLEKRTFRPAALAPALAERTVRELAQVYPMQYVLTFGGEPLLYPETVYAVHATATECGIPGRVIITNASFPVDKAEFHHVAQKLAVSGVNSMYLSVDTFHQEYIPLAIVKQNTRLLLEAGIENLAWNVSWVVSPDADNPWDERTRRIVNELADLPLPKDDIAITPDGEALRHLAEYLPPRQSIPPGTCGDKPFTGRLDEVKSITVEPDGRLTVCEHTLGDLNHGHAGEICEAYDPYRIPLFKLILEQGAAGLMELARQRGVDPDPQGYSSVCEVCLSMRRALAATQEVL